MQTYKLAVGLSACLAATTGCALFGGGEQTTLRIHEEVNAALPDAYAMKITLPKSNLALTISPSPTLTEKDILTASRFETAGGTAVLLRFDPDGLIKLEEMTTRMRGQSIVILLNGR